MEKVNVFLTGATGLIGRHILYELLPKYASKEYVGKIYLLIRGKKNVSPEDRILELLKNEYIPDYLSHYNLDILLSFIECINGDLCQNNLKEIIASKIKGNKAEKLYVIHSAGSTNLLTSETAKNEIYENNYLGTKRLFKALEDFNIKYIFISTAFSGGVTEGIISNNLLNNSNNSFRNHYEKYKYMLEEEIYKYCTNNGIDYQILRPSVVCGRLIEYPLYFTSKFDVFYAWAKFFYVMRAKGINQKVRIYVNKHLGLNIIPVDYVAKAVIKTFMSDIKELNLVHTNTALFKDFVCEILDTVGYKNYEFVEEFPNHLNKTETLYYRAVGNMFGPYGLSESNFDTKLLLQIMGEIKQPSIEDNMDELINFAVEREFSNVG